jgi:hypothetical protein
MDSAHARPSRLRRISYAAAGWAFLYATYRGYYGFGGTFGMFGVPASDETWRAINLIAAALLLGAAALPVVALRLWDEVVFRRVLLAIAWVITVGCVMHGIIDEMTRALSLAGVLEILYPAGFWASLDRRAADLQDIVFNEPWFIVEGLLWAAIAAIVLAPSNARRWWMASAAAAISLLVCIGLLSAFGIIGRFVVG